MIGHRSGYLQAVSHERLVQIAAASDAVIELLYRPGHFVVAGLPLAHVRPASAAPAVTKALDEAHVTGDHRTLTQDPVFAVDQLVEIAIRASSPAINDTFTALSCIDWLTAGLCHLSGRTSPIRVRRDRAGAPRLFQPAVSYERVVNGAFDKVRQAGRGMLAVAIRQLASARRVMEYAFTEPARGVAAAGRNDHAGSEESVPEPQDLQDIRTRYQEIVRSGKAAALGSTADHLV